MAVVGVAEAARRLGVSARRVRQMIADHKLPARRVGRVWAIDERDLAAVSRRPAHRPWNPDSAWAVLAAADGAQLPSLRAYERHRAVKRLQAGLPNIVASLSERAQRRTFYAHPADLDRIVTEPGVVRTAASASDDYNVDLVGPGPAEAYVSESVFEQIRRRHHIEERSDRPNLVLRVVGDAHWPFADGAAVAPRAVVAVDLLESSNERARRAGADLIESLTARPVVSRAAVLLPEFAGSHDIWPALLELSSSSHPEWTLVGGQMVMLHAAEHAAPPLRVSRDIDVVVNARIVTGAVREFVDGLESSGFRLAGADPDGVAHRYVRGGTSIDVLAPEGLGRRADLTTTRPGRTIETPGGTQALNRTELVPVEYGGERALIPRPSLLGAIVMKAAAVSVDDAPEAQQHDLALLLSLVSDPAALTTEMTKKDRARLRSAGLDSNDHPVWGALDPDAADRARLTLRTLTEPPADA